MKRKLYIAIPTGLVAAAAVVGMGASASASSQSAGPFTVTDAVTYDTVAGTTTATYTVTGAKRVGQFDATIPTCPTPQVRTISHNGKVWDTDPSTKQAGPLIRWPANNQNKPGDMLVYSYTVQGLFATSNETFALKSGNDLYTGSVDGIGCGPRGSSTPGGPGGNNSTVGNNGVAGALGQQSVLGVRSCVDRRKFTFRLHHFRHARVVDVTVLVNGKRKLHQRGSHIKKVTIRKLPQRNFTVKVVAKHNTGSTLTSVRRYKGCAKGHPKTTAHHARRHHRH